MAEPVGSMQSNPHVPSCPGSSYWHQGMTTYASEMCNCGAIDVPAVDSQDPELAARVDKAATRQLAVRGWVLWFEAVYGRASSFDVRTDVYAELDLPEWLILGIEENFK